MDGRIKDLLKEHTEEFQIDDMHENGVHDYLKFIKFGYGRCSDHASKDIRMGYMTRKEAIQMVKKYDSVKPVKDAKDGYHKERKDFDKVADTLEIHEFGKMKKIFGIKIIFGIITCVI